ncbi:hypothetical protein TcasGA2_TC033124 [Tribolium castaneum]|uniref:Uncharacterized protein n=1 Tax=Tribolium castaneum TaxID=7070 RepID=A0A139WH46_TRICA|nr:hypothetical protein TcasGA2_TC033124 [Tribolium castaneum]
MFLQHVKYGIFCIEKKLVQQITNMITDICKQPVYC